jgi:hypothetical protein
MIYESLDKFSLSLSRSLGCGYNSPSPTTEYHGDSFSAPPPLCVGDRWSPEQGPTRPKLRHQQSTFGATGSWGVVVLAVAQSHHHGRSENAILGGHRVRSQSELPGTNPELVLWVIGTGRRDTNQTADHPTGQARTGSGAAADPTAPVQS